MLLRLLLGYFHPWPNDAGFLVASERGWYAEAGLDVSITGFDALRGDALAHLARGEADLAVFPSNRLLVRRDLGEPLVGIAANTHRGMETIQTTRATGITRPRELAGRRLALNPTPRGRAMVRHLVAADGGDPDALHLVDSGMRELTVDDIVPGEIDATFGNYWAWDCLVGRLPEDERVTWPVDEIGAPRYHSYLLGTREDVVAAEPEALRTFLAVTERGFRAATEEPELALAAFERSIPYFEPERLARSLELVAPSWWHDGTWGVQRDDVQREYAAWLHAAGILSTPDAWVGATTNALLSERAVA
jgi:NitT/TauT family transport system substrate-binding protein